MSGTSGTTGPEPRALGPEPIRYSVASAAVRLGISERAVRKRIQVGTLRAEPHGRSYWVYLDPEPEPGPGGPEPGPVPLDRNGPEPGPAVALDPVRETAVVNLVQSMLAPFIAELGETKEQLGRVTAERDALERERDQLRDALERAERAAEPSTTPSLTASPETPQRGPERPWWRFWER